MSETPRHIHTTAACLAHVLDEEIFNHLCAHVAMQCQCNLMAFSGSEKTIEKDDPHVGHSGHEQAK